MDALRRPQSSARVQETISGGRARPESAPVELTRPCAATGRDWACTAPAAAAAGASSEHAIAVTAAPRLTRNKGRTGMKRHRSAPRRTGPCRSSPPEARTTSRRVNIFKKRRRNDRAQGPVQAGVRTAHSQSRARSDCSAAGLGPGPAREHETACCPSSMGSYAAWRGATCATSVPATRFRLRRWSGPGVSPADRSTSRSSGRIARISLRWPRA